MAWACCREMAQPTHSNGNSLLFWYLQQGGAWIGLLERSRSGHFSKGKLGLVLTGSYRFLSGLAADYEWETGNYMLCASPYSGLQMLWRPALENVSMPLYPFQMISCCMGEFGTTLTEKLVGPILFPMVTHFPDILIFILPSLCFLSRN